MTVQFSIAPDVRSMINADGGVLLNLKRGVCYSLNGVGARVWSLLAESRGLQPEVVVDQLATQFAVPRQQLAEDVVAFLRALENKGLVQAAGAKGYATA
jgi:hypothetical protein